MTLLRTTHHTTTAISKPPNPGPAALAPVCITPVICDTPSEDVGTLANGTVVVTAPAAALPIVEEHPGLSSNKHARTFDDDAEAQPHISGADEDVCGTAVIAVVDACCVLATVASARVGMTIAFPLRE